MYSVYSILYSYLYRDCVPDSLLTSFDDKFDSYFGIDNLSGQLSMFLVTLVNYYYYIF